MLTDKPSEHLLSLFSWTEQTIYLFNKMMSPQYAQKLNIDHLQDDLAKFFDGLIWAEKKNPVLVYQMFEMKSCHQIVSKYFNANPVVILRNSILLLGNCQPGGLVAEQLIEYSYPHCLLTHILNYDVLKKHAQEIGQYIGNFMKCYFKLFRIQWLNKFILEGGIFQLLQINLKYYNCSDFMARTNALNIVLDLLKHEQVRNFIRANQSRSGFYLSIFDRMTKLFRNQLVEFGLRIAHISKQDSVDYIFSELEDKIVLWHDISSNFSGLEYLLQTAFCNNVLVPLVMGPLQGIQIPLFSLKYSLFVLKKLIPVMKNLDILQVYIRMIFYEQNIFYDKGSLCKAFIEPFCLEKVMKKQIIIEEQEEKECSQKLLPFYKNLFSSKDNHFILMLNSLLTTLFQHAESCKQLSKTYGFGYMGQFTLKISKMLLLQLRENHHIVTIESILNTLITINKNKPLQGQLQHDYIRIFNHIISQLKNGLNFGQGKQNLNSSKSKNLVQYFFNDNLIYLGQTLEYDIGILAKVEFVREKNQEKYEKMFKIVFQWEIQKEQMSVKEFYSRMPDTPGQYLRYLFLKFGLIRKARLSLIDGIKQFNIFERYYQLMLSQCPYIPDDMYNPTQLQQTFQTCELIDEKGKQKNKPIYLIKEKNFFVLGVPKGQRILITCGVNQKHIKVEEQSKKKLRIMIKKFDYDVKDMVVEQIICMKSQEWLKQYLLGRNKLVIGRNLQFLKQCLKKSECQAPTVSLL